MSDIEHIAVPGAQPPAGHYSPAVAWRDLVFVSGQLPVRPDGAHSFEQPFEVQARQVLANLLAALAAADAVRGLAPGDPCEAAKEVSERNGAVMRDCRASSAEQSAYVEVAVDIPGPLPEVREKAVAGK